MTESRHLLAEHGIELGEVSKEGGGWRALQRECQPGQSSLHLLLHVQQPKHLHPNAS